MNKEKYKNLVETLPKESEELWFEYNLEVNKILQENQELKENYEKIYNENCILREKHDISYIDLLDENYRLKQVINRAIEYLTSYSSIHTIQFGIENDSLNDIELNKTLDEKTLNEMTNRYLKVHDKLLDILKEVK